METVRKFIQEFQAIFNQIGQITADYYQLQLDKLEKSYESTQENIVGDTEEANKKRLEAEEIYQRQKKEIEKKASKTALNISLIQAIANTAEADKMWTVWNQG